MSIGMEQDAIGIGVKRTWHRSYVRRGPRKPSCKPRSIRITPQGYAYMHWLDARRKLVAQVNGNAGWEIDNAERLDTKATS